MKRNWKNHIEGLRKFRGVVKNKIFLIEYPDSNVLSMAEMKLKRIEGICTGDYIEPGRFNNYRLSRDKQMLACFFGYKEEEDIVIFLTILTKTKFFSDRKCEYNKKH